MTQEEKAKAYDEVIGKLQGLIDNANKQGHIIVRVEDIKNSFPELKESEDERIRKAIVEFFELQDDNITYSFIPKKDILTWLEKQGEEPQGKSALEAAKEEKVDNQNCVIPTSNPEPKFHKGEWVVYNHDICQIVKREEGCNKLVTVFGIEKELVNERNLSTAHLWTIQDAKDGDVLVASDGSIFLFAGVFDCACRYYAALTACNTVKINKEVYNSYWETSRAVYPATKEQRDLLFSKMKEAGYEWYAGKKELHKIEDEPENYKQQVMSERTDLVKNYIRQKPTWSEKDEKKLSDIISILRGGENCYYNSPILIDWLKSLKERIGG